MINAAKKEYMNSKEFEELLASIKDAHERNIPAGPKFMKFIWKAHIANLKARQRIAKRHGVHPHDIECPEVMIDHVNNETEKWK